MCTPTSGPRCGGRGSRSPNRTCMKTNEPTYHGAAMTRLFAIIMLAVLAGPAFAQEVDRKKDVIYAKKMGYALTMDVATPAKANGLGVIFCVSGGWVSRHESIDGVLKDYAKPLLDRGYTVFAVVHGSQPKFTIPE